ncbi:CatA-like O-acetyltransferase [Luteipulveratus mongoliensis]|uniref:Chloramphenicol acetyltransferase n=1 Tax=Luteipulveratus mongoliensis TaxID=571913 RepID=A0A0K1JRG8_9MICO|nr:CatA-like O-acetyltransferase [Luteipulveratus mongoliensis]AKU19311.1 chloramphenicol acetyltransferase [Luteipulveratus mongoliensis]
MNTLRPLDLETWPRRGHFEHYTKRNPCTYSMTVELDATALRSALRGSGRTTYPAHVWTLATVINRHDELRLDRTADGSPAVWDVLHPAFTTFNAATETFACVCAEYDADFAVFHARMVETAGRYRDAIELFPQGGLPENTFDVSSLPWTSFTGFNLNIEGGEGHLRPILTLGRYVERGDRTLLPLAVQLNHAAADGLHAARLVNEVQALFDHPERWLTKPPVEPATR